MLNPDGVINGNYRCNLAGADLNRQWVDPSRKLHPTIFNTKLSLRKMKEERDILLFCDIHGHSRKKNIFIYGCAGKDNKKREQVFPILMRNNCDFFSLKDCCFLIQKDRESTARVALWKELSMINCYTLEVSFCGADIGKYEYFHFNYDLFNEMALSFCQSIMDLTEPEQAKVKLAMEEIDQAANKASNYGEKKEEKANNAQDDQDSDYSNDEPIKNDPPIQNNQNQNSQMGINTNGNQNLINAINSNNTNNNFQGQNIYGFLNGNNGNANGNTNVSNNIYNMQQQQQIISLTNQNNNNLPLMIDSNSGDNSDKKGLIKKKKSINNANIKKKK